MEDNRAIYLVSCLLGFQRLANCILYNPPQLWGIFAHSQSSSRGSRITYPKHRYRTVFTTCLGFTLAHIRLVFYPQTLFPILLHEQTKRLICLFDVVTVKVK